MTLSAIGLRCAIGVRAGRAGRERDSLRESWRESWRDSPELYEDVRGISGASFAFAPFTCFESECG